MRNFAKVMVLLLIVAIGPALLAQPVASQPQDPDSEPPGSGMERAFFEIDYFTYRAAFKLADGSEALLIRSSYRVNFLYQHHHPTLNHHYMSATVGFYFGKTMLGRSLIQNMSFDEVAFYPKWQDSAGYAHDLFLDTPLFTVSGPMTDGRMISGSLLIDDNALSQYIPMFGGYLTITGLKLDLIDGSEVTFDDTFYIELAKYSNEHYPRNATLTGEDVNFDVSDGYVNILNVGPSQFIVLLDLILGLAILGTAGVVVVMGILHVRGRITIPIISRFAMSVRGTPPPLRAQPR
ncbi:MAG: hypothetical protein ACW98Y_05350 [Candidatus Thorarchaeota archaeon]|jgi:hypothetical protein